MDESRSGSSSEPTDTMRMRWSNSSAADTERVIVRADSRAAPASRSSRPTSASNSSVSEGPSGPSVALLSSAAAESAQRRSRSPRKRLSVRSPASADSGATRPSTVRS